MTAATDTDYSALMEGIYEVYDERACDLLALVGKYCRDAGLDTFGPYDFSCDRYAWLLEISGVVDVKLEMLEEAEVRSINYYGVTFHLDVETKYGHQIASLAPENYTDGWVVDGRDPQAVSDRFELISRSPALVAIPELIKDYR